MDESCDNMFLTQNVV